jgi:membrane-bound inhibitor of C-type lysozyme
MEELATAAMMQNVDVSAQVVLSLQGSFERSIVEYQCEGLEPFKVDFVNAKPNFIAIVPIGPDRLVFVNVMSGSGAKYVSGQYEFWTKGSDATLTDLMAEPQTPVNCSEANNTP